VTRKTVVRGRLILVGIEMWERIQGAAAAESRERGSPLSEGDWVIEQLESALMFATWDEPVEDPN